MAATIKPHSTPVHHSLASCVAESAPRPMENYAHLPVQTPTFLAPPKSHSQVSWGGPQHLTNASPRENATASWQSFPTDQRPPSLGQNVHPPLTLHIPPMRGMYKKSKSLRPFHTVPVPLPCSLHADRGGGMLDFLTLPVTSTTLSASSQAHSMTSLPSFASLKESTGEKEHSQIAPVSSRLPCNLCSRLRPLTLDVIDAAAELHMNVQSSLSRSSSPVRCNSIARD